MSTIKFDKSSVLSLVNSIPKEAKIMLVGDQGVYLMSFDQPMPRTIVYAQGCNPDVDEDFYDNKNDLFGGDDGGDEVGSAGDLLRIANATAKWVVVKLTATQIKISSDGGVTQPAKVDASLLPPGLRKFVK